MEYSHIMRAVMDTPWAIRPSKLYEIMAFLELKSHGLEISEEDKRMFSAGPVQSRSDGSVSVIPVHGVISRRANLLSEFSGGASIDKLTAQFRAAISDPSVSAIVFDMHTPGGSVYGVPELTEEMMKARGTKPIVAVANHEIASAGYHIAVAADEIVVSPSAEIGSIGVYTAHDDISELMTKVGEKITLVYSGTYKVEGNPYEPLSDEAKDYMQQRVADYYEIFTKAVAKGRGVALTDVVNGFGQGRMVGAKEAVRIGMADRVGTLDDTIARLLKPRRAAAKARAERKLRLMEISR